MAGEAVLGRLDRGDLQIGWRRELDLDDGICDVVLLVVLGDIVVAVSAHDDVVSAEVSYWDLEIDRADIGLVGGKVTDVLELVAPGTAG